MVRRLLIALCCVVPGVVPLAGAAATQPAAGSHCRSTDWPMYGHDLSHSFAVPPGCSAIRAATVAGLRPAWYFHTADSVTASPAVSHGTVYVGSWDGTFYALDATTGRLRWRYRITAAAPSAFGRIVSSAAVVSAGKGDARRRVVVFGGGSSVWVLDARTGHRLASIDLDPRRAADRRKAAADPRVVEVESSPAVVRAGRGRRDIYVGMDVHDEARVGRTGVVALRLSASHGWSLTPRWKYDVETGRTYRGRAGLTRGSGRGLGCGGVWSSPAVDLAKRLLVVGTASCDYPATAQARHRNYSEELLALHLGSGRRAWSYRPGSALPRAQRAAAAGDDADFGASPNLFRLPGGERVVGDGSKDARYYVRRAGSGRAVTKTLAGQPGLVQDNFAVGGFLGSSGVELSPHGVAKRVIGGTAIPVPRSAADLDRATWDVRAIDPARGRVDWVYRLGAPTYSATSVVNDVAFVPLTLQSDVVALDADTGRLLWAAPLIGPPSSTAVVAGDSVYVGTGTRETDLEYKAVSSTVQQVLESYVGESPLSPISGVQAFRLAGAGPR